MTDKAKPLLCRGCNAESKPVEPGENCLGTLQTQSGFNIAFSHADGLTVFWLCNPCYKKCQEAAKLIVSIVKDPDVHFYGLLKDRG